ncbi:histidine phosphatase family protein [Candidatus Micrarchaeota archaeon]|nr:histidine phosphatase family protein [Candidatus Micrarchaeota archaeon]
MRLILIRHGETAQNVGGIAQGHQHGKLTPNGRSQARLLALRLKTEKIDYVISSDLGRVKDTLAPILKYHPNVPVEYSREVRERAMGVFEGRKFSEFKAEQKRLGRSRFNHRPPGGESYLMVRKRALKFYRRLLRDFRNKILLVCSHGAFNKVLLSILLGKSTKDTLEKLEQHNTCVNIIEFVEGRTQGRANLINCTKHLLVDVL